MAAELAVAVVDSFGYLSFVVLRPAAITTHGWFGPMDPKKPSRFD